MSDQEPQQREADSGDPWGEALWQIIKAVGIVLIACVMLPLLVPAIVTMLLGDRAATKAGFWRTRPWSWVVVVAGAAAFASLMTWEVVQIVEWIASGAAQGQLGGGRFLDGAAELWPQLWPWLIVNVASGLLLVPAAFVLHRRRVAERTRRRVIDNVRRQVEIESARHRAADPAAARRIGVRVNPRTGKVTRVAADAVRAPHAVGDRYAFGVVARPTIRTAADLWKDKRTIADWTDPRRRFTTLPGNPGSVRVAAIAESGAGKTVWINDVIGCAVMLGWDVVFYDAKGNPEDAAKTAAVARRLGATTAIAPPWDFFHGDAAQVTAKIMRQIPDSRSDASYYRDEILSAIQAVQSFAPIRSMRDLRDRLLNPEGHVADPSDFALLTREIGKTNETPGSRSLTRLLAVMRPLLPWLGDGNGWSYDDLPAQVTIVPLSPVDEAQVRLGDTMLMDLRNHLAERMRGAATGETARPLLVIVDEYPQLVTEGRDPADTAASLFEVARSAGVGLVIAGQSAPGFSTEEAMRARLFASGAAIVLGRTKDPEAVVSYAGTVERMEASGDAHGAGIRAGRTQHTFVIPPQAVREAADGQFWLIQGGAVVQFRAMPTKAGTPAIVKEPQADDPAQVDSELDVEQGSAAPPPIPADVDLEDVDLEMPTPHIAQHAEKQAAPPSFRPSTLDDA